MTTFPASVPDVAPFDHVVLRAAMSAYLGRYRGASRLHAESDLRIFLTWCTGQNLDPLAAVRADVERYVRWLQDVRRYQPSTVSRRLSVVVGFYRVCVIDQLLSNSPADYVRRPTVPAESPTLGLGHLQFEALITTARLSENRNDFALIAMLGLLGLRNFEACGHGCVDIRSAVSARAATVRRRARRATTAGASATTTRIAPVARTVFVLPMVGRSSTRPETRHRPGTGRRRIAWSTGYRPVDRPARHSWPVPRRAGRRCGPARHRW
jgi:integrase